MNRSPNVLYVGDTVEIFIEDQGWRLAKLTQVHPNFTAQRLGLPFKDPVSHTDLRRVVKS